MTVDELRDMLAEVCIKLQRIEDAVNVEDEMHPREIERFLHQMIVDENKTELDAYRLLMQIMGVNVPKRGENQG